jgi:Flp pilus assembly protein TadD
MALSGISSAVTFWAQKKGGAVASMVSVPLEARIENALVSYVAYLRQTFWPAGLACFYPLPGQAQSRGSALLCLLILASISALVLRVRRRRPYLAVGWLWYLGTLVPVIGLVQVGSQVRADRYTYIPLVGIFVMVAWGIRALWVREPGRGSRRMPQAVPPPGLWLSASAAILTLASLAAAQVGYWRNTRALFEHATAVTRDNELAQTNFGWVLMNEGKLDEALAHFQEALRIRPNAFNARFDVGAVLLRKGRVQEAIAQYREALRLKPDYSDAYSELGAALARLRRLDEAVAECRKALEIDPQHSGAHNNLAVALALRGDVEGAMRNYREAIRINPDYAEARSNLGALLARAGRLDDAVAELRSALRIQPAYRSACNNLIRAVYLKGDYTAAWQEVERCRMQGVELEPAFLDDLAHKMPAPSRKE